MKRFLPLAGLAALVATTPLDAQQPGPMFFIEGRGGSVVPTFDIADVAESGKAFGATVGLRTSPIERVAAPLDVIRDRHLTHALGIAHDLPSRSSSATSRRSVPRLEFAHAL